MKLASLKSGRDGRLVVVDRALERMAVAPVATMQAALDDWATAEPKLREAAERLEAGLETAAQAFDPAQLMAPLPRGHHWADGSAYVNHVELVRRARGAELPPSFWTDPLMYQGAPDAFLGPVDPILLEDEAWGIDFESEVAVFTDDVPMGASSAQARDAIRLVAVINDVSLRNLIPSELAKGFGFLQSKSWTAFSPVAVTPDELGAAWDGGSVDLPLLSWRNGELVGRPNCRTDMTFDFATLVAHAAKTRPLGAGAIIGSGTVSNRGPDGGAGLPVSQGGLGYSCIAEIRTVETLLTGAPVTPFLAFGERVRVEMLDAAGRSIFGAIDQTVTSYRP
jgi:fumarylacetoacetate (FAA) hydrolase